MMAWPRPMQSVPCDEGDVPITVGSVCSTCTAAEQHRCDGIRPCFRRFRRSPFHPGEVMAVWRFFRGRSPDRNASLGQTPSHRAASVPSIPCHFRSRCIRKRAGRRPLSADRRSGRAYQTCRTALRCGWRIQIPTREPIAFGVSVSRYRVIITLVYAFKRGPVKFVNTHAQYHGIDTGKVWLWISGRLVPKMISVSNGIGPPDVIYLTAKIPMRCPSRPAVMIARNHFARGTRGRLGDLNRAGRAVST